MNPIIKFTQNDNDIWTTHAVAVEELFLERNGAWYRADTGEPVELEIMTLPELIKKLRVTD